MIQEKSSLWSAPVPGQTSMSAPLPQCHKSTGLPGDLQQKSSVDMAPSALCVRTLSPFWSAPPLEQISLFLPLSIPKGCKSRRSASDRDIYLPRDVLQPMNTLGRLQAETPRPANTRDSQMVRVKCKSISNKCQYTLTLSEPIYLTTANSGYPSSPEKHDADLKSNFMKKIGNFEEDISCSLK